MSELNFDLLEKNIRILIQNQHITQQKLAEITGMTQANVSKALNPHENKHFTLEHIYRISQYFGISIDKLVGNTAPAQA
ncbi:MAG: helix-turn-helix transcriptional regulator, partial [Oscillospiraceae bacterium]|nr:helix-turn-helix transcriptional regulator [Oscillospiraceae bacterium]